MITSELSGSWKNPSPIDSTDFDQDLYKKLHTSPFNAPYKFPLEESVLSTVSEWCASSLVANSPEFRDILFNNQGKSQLFKLEVAQDNDHKHKRTVCGHVFRKGEPVYRCRTCGVDETCVMCSACFQASNHENHDTFFHISPNGSGCCDCGDAEAWKTDIKCTLHSQSTEANENLTELPQELIQALNTTIATILDFIIDTFVDAPFIGTESPVTDDILHANLPENEKEIDENVNKTYPFALVLWNDESHSFNEVISQLTKASGCDRTRASAIADRVDQHGRDIVLVSPNIRSLCDAGTEINNISLAVSVRSARETFREELAGFLLDWILKLNELVEAEPVTVNGVQYTSPLVTIRQIVCQQLFKPKRNIKDMVLARDWKDQLSNEEEVGIQEIERNLWKFTVENSTLNEQFLKRSRIDELLFADSKMWKRCRAVLKDILLKFVILGGDETRKYLALRFAYCYLRMADNFLTRDREFDLNIIHFGVQLFTVPSIANFLITNTPVLSIMSGVLKTMFLADSRNIQQFYRSFKHSRNEILPQYKQITFEEDDFKNRRYDFVFHHIKYLLATPQVKTSILRTSDFERNWSSLLDLLCIWQGMNPQRRQIREHIEYESDYWLQAFTASTHIQAFVESLSECFLPSDQVPTEAFTDCTALLSAQVSAWSQAQLALDIRMKQITLENQNPNSQYSSGGFHQVQLFNGLEFSCPEFKVSTQHVSFHHPLQWLLSKILMLLPKYCNGMNLESSLAVLKQCFDFEKVFANRNLKLQENCEKFSHLQLSTVQKALLMIEEPLRATVLTNQINAGLWVRNGMSMRQQATHYKEITLRPCHDSDIFILQLVSNLLDTNQFMTVLIDRFELTDWFLGKWTSDGEILEAHEIALVESFLKFLNIFLTERTFLNATEAIDEIKREVMHHLATSSSGLSYSELLKRVSERLSNQVDDASGKNQVEQVLNELANFKWPIGLNDKGVYLLKSELFEKVDPWFWHYSKNQHEEVDELIKTKLGKKKGPVNYWEFDISNVRQVRLMHASDPKPFNFGVDQFCTSPVLVQVVFYSLNTVGKPQSEGVVKQTLHLIRVSLELEPLFEFKFSLMSTSLEFEKKTLYQVILELLESSSDDLTEYKHEMQYVLQQIASRNPKADALLQEWTTRVMAALGIEKTVKSDAKKLAAKARKEALMQQFKQQQQSFMENMKDELLDDDQEMEIAHDELYEFPCGNCIVCQEVCKADGSPYGMLGYLQPSTLQRFVDFEQTSLLDEICNLNQLDSKVVVEGVTEDVAFPSIHRNWNPKSQSTGLFINTCGHLIHQACFKDYKQSIKDRHQSQTTRNQPENSTRNEYMCPLCKNLGNLLLPLHFERVSLEPLTAATAIDLKNVKVFNEELNVNQVVEYQISNIKDLQNALLGMDHSFNWTGLDSISTSNLKGLFLLYEMRLGNMIAYTNSESVGGEGNTKQPTFVQLWHVLADTVALIEISARGNGKLIDGLNHQTKTILRVLGQVTRMFSAISCLSSELNRQFLEYKMNDYVNSSIGNLWFNSSIQTTPALLNDVHKLLVIYTMTVCPQNKQGYQLFRQSLPMFYVMNLVQTIIACFQSPFFYAKSSNGFCDWIGSLINVPTRLDTGKVLKFCKATVLPLMRRMLLLEYSLFFKEPIENSDDEFDRLCSLLQLSSIESVFQLDKLDCPLQKCIVGWCKQLTASNSGYFTSIACPISITLPTVYQLVPLPKKLDTLLQLSVQIECSACKTVPFSSAICLICGKVLCSQSGCCYDQETGFGELSLHKKECGAGIGLYFLTKKCALVLLHGEKKGSFMQPPYMDVHGEVDVGLRRGKPLFLNESRYEELRKLWHSHAIPSFIARKMEQVYDVGGWMTF